jgi:light-regulated signal transduction histidine kinase (bacteriophytochrome)
LSRVVLEKYSRDLDEKGQYFLRLIQEETKKMLQLIDDLMAFSRAKRQEMNLSTIDMGELAKTVFDEISSLTSHERLKVEIKPLLKSPGDQAMIRQVFYNLISNAIKFTRPKGTGIIEIGCLEGINAHTYYVKDNGVGFDMQRATQLFEVFQRLHSADEFEGTGVGLAIVQRIIHRHGGRVWADGKPNEGAVFYFSLPAGK